MDKWTNKTITRRYKVQNTFKRIGQGAVFCIFLIIATLLGSIIHEALPAFKKTYILVEVPVIEGRLAKNMSSRQVVYQYMNNKFDVQTRAEKKAIKGLFSSASIYELDMLKKNSGDLVGVTKKVWLSGSDNLDQFVKGKIARNIPESKRKFTNLQMGWVERLQRTNEIEVRFNKDFFLNTDSRDASQAGILGAVIGSVMTLIICLVLSLVIGVAGAVYLEEFSAKSRISFLIEMTINNLAAVPSIIFGLLGLAILLNVFGMPRSASLTGGVVLAMMSLPTIMIVTRNALKAVPDTLRLAGLGLGANRLQVVFHHILPRAIPSIITGSIIAMAQALGETAPLLMIGMMAFIADIPNNILEPAVTLPVQIFLWADMPETAFIEKTSAAILVLLCIVFILIATATCLRNKFEK